MDKDLVSYLVQNVGKPGPDGYDIDVFFGNTPEYKKAKKIIAKQHDKEIAKQYKRLNNIKPIAGLNMALVRHLVHNIGKPGPDGYDTDVFYGETPEYKYALKILQNLFSNLSLLRNFFRFSSRGRTN